MFRARSISLVAGISTVVAAAAAAAAAVRACCSGFISVLLLLLLLVFHRHGVVVHVLGLYALVHGHADPGLRQE